MQPDTDTAPAPEHPTVLEPEDDGPAYVTLPAAGLEDAPPAGDFSEPMDLAAFGITDVPPSWVKLGAKPTTLRILYRMPVPDGFEPGNDQGRIPVLARFKVEYFPSGETRVWDVSSKKLLALLGGIPNLRAWFHVTRTGSGPNTTYTVHPGTPTKGKGA